MIKKVGEWERNLLLIGHFRPDDKYLPCLVDGGRCPGGPGGQIRQPDKPKPKAKAAVKPAQAVSAPTEAVCLSAIEGQKRNNTHRTHAATKKHVKVKIARKIVEFCTGEESVLGQPTVHANDCIQHRLTIANDLTKYENLQVCCSLIDDEDPVIRKNTTLFAAIPCTGGSMWYNINKMKPGGMAKLRKHLQTYRKLW